MLQVVEQLVSPGGFSQQPKCSSGLSRESSRPPAWQTTNLPASTVAMSGFELGRGLSDTALQDAASAGALHTILPVSMQVHASIFLVCTANVCV